MSRNFDDDEGGRKGINVNWSGRQARAAGGGGGSSGGEEEEGAASSTTSSSTTTPISPWEQIARSIQTAPNEREVIALLTDYLDENPVDTFGCADTNMWDELVASEQLYVDLTARCERLQPQIERLKTRLRSVARPIAYVSEMASAGDGNLLLELLVAVIVLSLSPVWIYKWYTSKRLQAIQAEQKRAFKTLDTLGKRVADTPCSTLLHVAVTAGNRRGERKEIIKFLLERGASLELADSN
eukprot:CAMPEP_0205914974 /NCGR_PEP_ID=MMETSP1325-20131115/7561_1 /ASSEMBLY_ACC=CAM_ASM_000708 /TAXON_ID=236786 /ORGANISM="Florenciella sp., Strain RCC1007" /LENGTH=240 /DNA_ID=CAMNT_0053282091 /DNA_START=173 /DNA_END=892 /DNA_ORIENTATION=-